LSTPSTPPLLSFDEARRQIESAAAARLTGADPKAVNGALPALEYKKGELSVTLTFKSFQERDFFSCLDVLKQYYRSFPELSRAFQGANLVADLASPITRKLAERKSREAETELPPQVKIAFRFDPRAGGGSVVFTKAGLLQQEEVNCVLDLWQRHAFAGASAPGDGDAVAALERLGAVVFRPDPDFAEDRLAGYEQTKKEVRDTIVLPLVRPEVFQQLGALTRTRPGSSVPRAVLFEGPPGTGKTTMARVIAGQSGLPMVYVPIESIMSKWFGESERRLDAIFAGAGSLGRSVVFLDEIDAFAGSRDKPMHEATRRILSVLLRQLQGLVDTSNVVVVGATNRQIDLDPALLNRFNRSVHFPLPSAPERAAIIRYYAKHLEPAEIASLADASAERSGRELEDACGMAERLWASELIQSGEAVRAPPAEAYLRAFRLKFPPN
jgi:ATPase family associated with various cellular activities (AAA)